MTVAPPTVVLIATGRELLTGRVQDSNSNFLAQRLFNLGWKVVRVCQVDDDFDAVCIAIRQAFDDDIKMVITTGGLGPTYDDGTLGYVGKCLGLPVETDQAAKKMVIRRYSEIARTGFLQAGDLNPARMKMAKLPMGSQPLENTVGTAPGVFLEYDEHLMFCLPGPPREMRAMFDQRVSPLITGLTQGRRFFRKVITLDQPDESVLDPFIAQARQQFSDVYFKTTPKGFTDPVMSVFMETWGMPEASEILLKQASVFLHNIFELNRK